MEESLPDVIQFVFDQIEEMKINYWFNNDLWKEFIARHKTLKVLKIFDEINGEHFIQLMLIAAENLPRLFEIKLSGLYDITVQTVISFMEARTNLKKIDVEMSRQTYKLFRDNLLTSKWSIIADTRNHLDSFRTLVRKDID